MMAMSNNSELTEEALVQQLTAACERQIEALRETWNLHECLFDLHRSDREEPDSQLRLRKVYCHTISVTSWYVDKWAVHVMAPDIRAALVQLRTLVHDGVCVEVHEAGDRDCTVLSDFSTWDGMLAPLSHPTATVLAFFSSAGGLRDDGIRCLRSLCGLLRALLISYAAALDMEAFRLGLSVEASAKAIAERADPRAELGLVERYLATE